MKREHQQKGIKTGSSHYIGQAQNGKESRMAPTRVEVTREYWFDNFDDMSIVDSSNHSFGKNHQHAWVQADDIKRLYDSVILHLYVNFTCFSQGDFPAKHTLHSSLVVQTTDQFKGTQSHVVHVPVSGPRL